MCGRYTLFTSPEAIESHFEVAVPDSFAPRYNCAPGQELPVVRPERGTLDFLEWGLIPEWSDDDSGGLINARAETVREKPSFREAYSARRCLVPANGFYEWVDDGSGKRPYRVAFEDDRLFAMAGLWERWQPDTTQTGLGDFGASGVGDAASEAFESFTVVTTEPNEVVSPLHHRMAVVLDPDEYETWLGGSDDEAASVLDPYPPGEMHAYPVSKRVNSPANDGPDLIEAVDT